MIQNELSNTTALDSSAEAKSRNNTSVKIVNTQLPCVKIDAARLKNDSGEESANMGPDKRSGLVFTTHTNEGDKNNIAENVGTFNIHQTGSIRFAK